MKFKITDGRKFEKGTLQGFFTLHVGDFGIRDWTYHTKNGKSWVNASSRQYKDKETGEVKYNPIVFIADDDRYQAFQKWAVSECEKAFSSATEDEGSSPF